MRLIKKFLQEMYYQPKWYHWIVSIAMLPLSLTYGCIMYARRLFSKQKSYDVPIISIGNLVVGGSGKTPFVIALAKHYAHRKVTIISRGYGRQSSGLVHVSKGAKVLCSVEQSGDEAMLIASSVPSANMIVSEDRNKAISHAMSAGSQLILLDDGFNRTEISKFEILLEPKTTRNILPLPSGPFREFSFTKSVSDLHLKESIDYFRVITYENLTTRMILVTAIANPTRLDEYLPSGVIDKVFLDDHAYFDEPSLKKLLDSSNASSLLVTQKDFVKMRGFKLPISQIQLKLEIKKDVLEATDSYIGGFNE